MRPPTLRASFEPSELVVDSFAGGGGASTGIEWALGRPVDIAINHDREAIRMHELNHPETKHYQSDIWALFQAPLVRALLAGTKTQTRRLAELRLDGETTGDGVTTAGYEPDPTKGWGRARPGDRLWVRETWRTVEREEDGVDGIRLAADDAFIPIPNEPLAAGLWVDSHANGKHGDSWRPSLFMPRWASRITLEVTEVRAQRLQEVTEEEARAEGVEPPMFNETWLCIPKGTDGPYEKFVEPDAEERAELEHVKHQPARPMWSAQAEFRLLWDKINGQRASWESNPWVWAISFRRIEVRRG